jgi:hypothetical protein
MGRVIQSFNRGVSIRIWGLEGWGSRLEKNRRIFAIRKMERIEKAAVIWISNSRFAIRNGDRRGRGEEWGSTAGPGRVAKNMHD